MSDDYSTDPVDVPEGRAESFLDVADRRYSRRQFLKTGTMAGAGLFAAPLLPAAARPSPGASTFGKAGYSPGELAFDAIAPEVGDSIVAAEGYRWNPVIAWGDPLFSAAGPFELSSQTAARQELSCGFNCDFLQFLPLPRGSNNPTSALLWVNHEYTDADLMFPDWDPVTYPTEDQAQIELAAHGASVVEIRRHGNGDWDYVPDSPYNRRISARSTVMRISGPAAGDEELKTAADPSGTEVVGMLNNCGGGITPWGTILTAEENFHQYFAFDDGTQGRYGVPTGASERQWEKWEERFDLGVHPNEVNRFGWMVEVDPYDPDSTPVKRTALGRFKHEACTVITGPSNRVVAYSGDDERFDYIYKFVSNNPMGSDPDVLDDGVLYVARFSDDGTGEWLPLVWGEGPLTAANGFVSQADVLIRTREAADALGATPMDRPEDVETNPVNGKVYVALTNNTRRTADDVDVTNPRPNNAGGHILEIDDTIGPGGAEGTSMEWEIFLLCGDPDDPSTYFAGFPKDQVSPVANPDNLEFDGVGNLWIATDGQPSSLEVNDAIHAVATEGPFRGQVKQFLSAVPDAEVASLIFGAGDKVLFASIQHPGEGSALTDPSSHFPDGGDAPPRPTVIAVTRERGNRPIGR